MASERQAAAIAAADRLVAQLGMGFHPDTRAADYVHVGGERDGQPFFDEEGAAQYERDVDALWEAGCPYEAGMDAMRRAGLPID